MASPSHKPLIVHVIDSLGHGGAEHQLVSNVLGLLPDFDAVVCHLGAPGDVAHQLRASGVSVHCLSEARARKPDALRLAARLRAVLAPLRPSIIHSSLFLSDAVAGGVGQSLRVPVVGTFCSLVGDEQRLVGVASAKNWKLAGETLIWAAAKRLHRRSIAISHEVKARAVKSLWLDRASIDVIYRGADPSPQPTPEARAALRSQLNIDADQPMILAVGRLIPVKGHRLLLDALARPELARLGPTLVMVGEGWLEPELKRHADELGVSGAIRWLGVRGDVRQLLQAADVFAFPSLSEGLGAALVEATVEGLPSVAMRVPPMNEVVAHGESGLLTAPGDALEFAQALARILEDAELRRRMAAAARARGERFGRGKVIAELAAVYRGLL